MTVLRIVFTALIASSVAACAGPAPSSTGYPSYGGSAYGSPTPSSTNGGSRQTRLTPTHAKLSLATLPGMSGDDLATRLGAPQFRRRDGQVEIWQYRGSACTLDVFLYADGGDLKVRYVEARGRDAETATDPKQARDCATALIDSRANAGPG